MNTQSVIVLCDVDIEYSGESPVYRLYVGSELFTERTWIWPNEYLTENITIEAPYGLYQIKYELLPHPNAVISVTNAKVNLEPINLISLRSRNKYGKAPMWSSWP